MISEVIESAITKSAVPRTAPAILLSSKESMMAPLRRPRFGAKTTGFARLKATRISGGGLRLFSTLGRLPLPAGEGGLTQVGLARLGHQRLPKSATAAVGAAGGGGRGGVRA